MVGIRSRLLFAVAAFGLVVLVPTTAALAHIDPDPIEAQAGSEVVVGFTVQHGCDGSPTDRLDMRLPEGTSAGTAEPPDGWTGRVEGEVVTFEGGPLPDAEVLTFRVRLVLPATPDTTIYFPFVQRCEVGEIRWIDIPADGSGPNLEEPAPAMRLFGPVATSGAPSSSPPTSSESSTTTVEPSTTPAPSTTATGGGPTTTPADPSVAVESSDAGSNSTLLVAVAVGATAVIVGAVLALVRAGRTGR